MNVITKISETFAVVPDMPRNMTVLETKSRSVRLSATSTPASLAVNDVIMMPTSLAGLDVTSWSVTFQPVASQSTASVTSREFDNGMS